MEILYLFYRGIFPALIRPFIKVVFWIVVIYDWRWHDFLLPYLWQLLIMTSILLLIASIMINAVLKALQAFPRVLEVVRMPLVFLLIERVTTLKLRLFQVKLGNFVVEIELYSIL